MDSQRRWKSRLLFSGTILVLLSMACVKDHGRIVIQDPETTAWMLINNTFMRPDGENPVIWAQSHLWDGILIQIGDYEGSEDLFDSVVLESNNTTEKVLMRGEFVWINVQSENPDRTDDPLDVAHTGMLWPDLSYNGDCDAVNDCADKPCLCTAASCDSSALQPIDRQCLRMRSLHGYFKPFAFMTYWLGPKGFGLQGSVPGNDDHLMQTFTFKDKVKVSVYDGKSVTGYNADTIRIKSKVVSKQNPRVRPHAGFHSPPWEP